MKKNNKLKFGALVAFGLLVVVLIILATTERDNVDENRLIYSTNEEIAMILSDRSNQGTFIYVGRPT